MIKELANCIFIFFLLAGAGVVTYILFAIWLSAYEKKIKKKKDRYKRYGFYYESALERILNGE